MYDLEKRLKLATSSILENEQLTADLDDEAADQLLQWGLALAEKIVMTTEDLPDEQVEDATYTPMRALRKMLRAVNNWASSHDDQQLARVLEQANVVHEAVGQATAVVPAMLTNIQTIPDLRKAIEPPPSPEPVEISETTADDNVDDRPQTPQKRMALLRQSLANATDPTQILQARQQTTSTKNPISGQENDEEEKKT